MTTQLTSTNPYESRILCFPPFLVPEFGEYVTPHPALDETMQKLFAAVVPSKGSAHHSPRSGLPLEQILSVHEWRQIASGEFVRPYVLPDLVQILPEVLSAIIADYAVASPCDPEQAQKVAAFLEKYKAVPLDYFFNEYCQYSIVRFYNDTYRDADLNNPCPFIASSNPIEGQDHKESKRLFTRSFFFDHPPTKHLPLACYVRESRIQDEILRALDSCLDGTNLNATWQDIEALQTKAGTMVGLFVVEESRRRKIWAIPNIVSEVNRTKKIYAQTFNNPDAEVEIFKKKLAGNDLVLMPYSKPALLKAAVDLGFEVYRQRSESLRPVIILDPKVWGHCKQLSTDPDNPLSFNEVVIIATHLATNRPTMIISTCGDRFDRMDYWLKQIQKQEQYPIKLIGLMQRPKGSQVEGMLSRALSALQFEPTQRDPNKINERAITLQTHKIGVQVPATSLVVITNKDGFQQPPGLARLTHLPNIDEPTADAIVEATTPIQPIQLPVAMHVKEK